MSVTDKPSSEEVAHEAEDVRAGLANTLQQLRDNLKPEHVIEEVVSNARIGANTVADGLYGLAREHPLPALLIGAGCAMVLGFGSKSALKRTPIVTVKAERRPEDRVTSPIPYRAVNAHPRYATSPVKERTTMNELTGRFQSQGPASGSRLSGLLQEQPLILAALGVAVGAAIGAALPHTSTEDEWMGSTSASVRHAAQEAAQHEIEDLKAVATRTTENVRQSAADHGVSAENLNDLVHDVGDKTRSAIRDIGDTAHNKA